mgnify:FL=1
MRPTTEMLKYGYIATDIAEAIHMMKGYLRLIVMKTLSFKRLSGYDLIKEIET